MQSVWGHPGICSGTEKEDMEGLKRFYCCKMINRDPLTLALSLEVHISILVLPSPMPPS